MVMTEGILIGWSEWTGIAVGSISQSRPVMGAVMEVGFNLYHTFMDSPDERDERINTVIQFFLWRMVQSLLLPLHVAAYCLYRSFLLEF